MRCPHNFDEFGPDLTVAMFWVSVSWERNVPSLLLPKACN
jgi:hypothetical protein